MFDFHISGNGPAANFTRILQAAGYNVTDEKAMQWGLLAYNSALLTWKAHNKEGKFSLIAPLPRNDIGRNQPCVCGSGVKYKKCCLQKTEAGAPTPGIRAGGRIPFGPDLIPNMSDDDAVLKDMAALSKIMDTDGELKSVRFSTEKVSEFLLKNQLKPGKADIGKEIDNLAFKYAKASGEHRILSTLNDKLLKAADHAQNEAELRALTLGVMLAMAYKAMKDTENLLSILLFRKAMVAVIEPVRAVDKIVNKLGGRDILLRRLESKDSSLTTELVAAFEGLSESEKQATIDQSKKDDDALWGFVRDKEFPVKLPFVTALPYIIRLQQIAIPGSDVSAEQFKKVMCDGTADLLSEDSKLYLFILDEWLKQNVESKKKASLFKRKNKWLSSVESLRTTVIACGFEYYVDGLVASTLSSGGFIQLHEDEAKILKSLNGGSTDAAALGRYADLMESLGHPKLAERTRRYAQECSGLGFQAGLRGEDKKIGQHAFGFA